MIKMKIIIMMSVLLILLIAWFFISVNQNNKLNFSCSSYYEQKVLDNQFMMITNNIITFSKDGSGSLSMDGVVTHFDLTYKVRRDYHFKYTHKNNNIYQLFDIEVLTAGQDNTHQSLLDQNFFSVQRTSPHTIYIGTLDILDKAHIIGGLYAPAFVCISE